MGENSPNTETDEQLASRARAASLSSFEALARRYQAPLMQFLLRRCAARQDAEDVIQETFLRAWRSIRSYREGSPFKPWLFVIAARLAVDSARRQRRRDPFDDQTPSQITGDPLRRAEENETKHRLWQLVRRILPDEPFQAIWLHYGESLSAGEIAGITGRSRMWVKTTLFRARAKIKLAMESRQV